MTPAELMASLAEKVMRWSVHPERYLMENRRWIPIWRFQPLKRIEDAFRLLDGANPDEYSISLRNGEFIVRVRISGVVGEASDSSRPRAITHAIALAIGLKPEPAGSPETGMESK